MDNSMKPESANNTKIIGIRRRRMVSTYLIRFFKNTNINIPIESVKSFKTNAMPLFNFKIITILVSKFLYSAEIRRRKRRRVLLEIAFFYL